MQPLIYGELTPWYRLLDPPEDHREETAAYLVSLRRAASDDLHTLLELGAGAGHNGLHLKEHLSCTLTDLSPEMLALSRAINPECQHELGDMRTMRLDRTFDAVLVHDAICYMKTREDLRAAAKTAFVHTRPGGAALFVPDHIRDTFHEHTTLEGTDDAARSLRCTMWTWDPDPEDESYTVDFAFLLRDGTTMRAVHDQHIEGLFAQATWEEILKDAGFDVLAMPDPMFVCTRPQR